tara:strand:- start:1550 stop:2536 length:987 start_codon:yes stop_codon:yes gene_type:complete
MIHKTFEINKINIDKYNLFLFYGENEGYKNEIIKNRFETRFENKIYRYEEKEVLEKKEGFFNSILSKSFFENEKLIIISRASDKIKDIIEEIELKKIEDIKIILSANILEKKSKLRIFFEKNKNAICIAFYADNSQTLNSIANNFFKEKKISISQQTINLFIERCKGNRENLNNELKKIENFSKDKKIVNVDDILKLTNLAENYNASELTDNCLAKNIKKTVNILNENNYSNDDCILIIRTLLIKSKRILKLREELNNKNNIDQVIANFKPPIFWKDKAIVKKQVENWPIEKINNMVSKINETELLIKKNSYNSLYILSDFIINQAKS